MTYRFTLDKPYRISDLAAVLMCSLNYQYDKELAEMGWVVKNTAWWFLVPRAGAYLWKGTA